ncbi:MAG: gliding motility lipoprotein GldH [Chitinophagaceae bacterium]|nr:gliding motility lipoprotein GldH [Chitinophagaceae bacterium]
MKKISLTYFFYFLFSALHFFSCAKIDLYEKQVSIHRYKWQSNYKPSFKFIITDTASPYQLFIIIRHNEKYNYNNLWLNLYIKAPGSAKANKVQYELPLATNEKGWLGTGMDDIYEHRVNLTPANEKFYFKRPGEYTFTIEHIMREDPLQNVMNIGLRLEKKPI